MSRENKIHSGLVKERHQFLTNLIKRFVGALSPFDLVVQHIPVHQNNAPGLISFGGHIPEPGFHLRKKPRSQKIRLLPLRIQNNEMHGTRIECVVPAPEILASVIRHRERMQKHRGIRDACLGIQIVGIVIPHHNSDRNPADSALHSAEPVIPVIEPGTAVNEITHVAGKVNIGCPAKCAVINSFPGLIPIVGLRVREYQRAAVFGI
ncbi:unknown [Sutterella sp. CAG:351]|nr:unknown [Sutterella sp. CAG:351]